MNSKEIWNKHFRQKNLLNAISQIEKETGFPDEFIRELRDNRADNYSFYSEFIHSSYDASMIGSYLRGFEGGEELHLTLFGKVAPASKSTILNLCDILFYFNLAIPSILKSKYSFKALNPDKLLVMYTYLHECYKQVYINLKEIDEKI